jgi:hypothetical protein
MISAAGRSFRPNAPLLLNGESDKLFFAGELSRLQQGNLASAVRRRGFFVFADVVRFVAARYGSTAVAAFESATLAGAGDPPSAPATPTKQLWPQPLSPIQSAGALYLLRGRRTP